jgi:CBS domain-containing protein
MTAALVKRFRTYPLVDSAGFAGMATLNRLRPVSAADRATTPLRAVAWPPSEVPVTRPDDPLAPVLGRLAGCSGGRAVVVEGDRVVGVLSPTDVARALQLQRDFGAFDPYPAGGREDQAVPDPGSRS